MSGSGVIHQPTLLGVTEPAVADTARTERIQLDATSWIDVTREWLGGADELAFRLAETVP